MTEWISAEAAAERLGVKRATLYAYVSRGVLMRKRADDGRGSLFEAREIEKLARRGRPRHTAGQPELVIESALTEISGERLSYRGYETVVLAATHSFEDVATLLWTGELPSKGTGAARPLTGEPEAWPAHHRAVGTGPFWPAVPPGPWFATPEAIAVGTAAQSALPTGALPIERLQVIVPALATTDGLRLHLESSAVIAAGRAMIAGMTGCLPTPGAAARAHRPADAEPSIAELLWDKLCLRPLNGRAAAGAADPGPGLMEALRVALVLLADHELAASTLAARVAASVRADPYAVVATGLGALGGPLHGGASLGAEDMLAAATAPADAPRVVGDLLRRTGRIPGFGHFVYRSGDPRAIFLLECIAGQAPDSPRLAVANAILTEMRRRALPEPNIDFALAVLKDVAGMIRGAGEAIFAVARTVGWLAHALEEYARESPIRLRVIYTGAPRG